MTVWYKQGVVGDLSTQCLKCLGRIHGGVYGPAGHDMYVTSIRDGNHSAGSLHYRGDAFDFRKSICDSVNTASSKITVSKIRKAAGRNFDVVEEQTHFHVEYDPK